ATSSAAATAAAGATTAASPTTTAAGAATTAGINVLSVLINNLNPLTIAFTLAEAERLAQRGVDVEIARPLRDHAVRVEPGEELAQCHSRRPGARCAFKEDR